MHYTLNLLAGLLITVILYSNVEAQNPKVLWGDELKESKITYLVKVVGQDDEGIYIVRGKGDVSMFTSGTLYIEKYDFDMQLLFSKELLMPGIGKGNKVQWEDMFYLQGKLILFSSYRNNETNKYYAFANYVHKNGTIDNTIYEMDVIDFKRGNNKGNFDFVLSKDSTKILIYHNEPFNWQENERFAYKVIDTDLNILWQKDIELNFNDSQFHIQNYLLDNNGNVHLVAIKYHEKEVSHEIGMPFIMPVDYINNKKNNYTLLSYYYENDLLVEHTVGLEDGLISFLDIALNEDNELTAVGFYSSFAINRMKGIVYLKLDSGQRGIVLERYNEFDDGFLSLFAKENATGKFRELKDFRVKDLHFSKDGKLVMVAEQDISYNKKINLSKDILVANINNEGIVEWWARIPKESSGSTADKYLSYAFFDSGDKVNLIYNDDPRNVSGFNLKKSYPMKAINKAVTVLVSIEKKSGSINKTTLFPSVMGSCFVKPIFFERISENKMFMVAGRDHLYRFGKIVF